MPGWEISYSGFLEHKTGFLGSWSLYWVVLDKDSLIIFSDETEAEAKGKITINSSCVVEAEPNQGGRSFVFSLRNEIIPDSKLIFAAFDIPSIEGWMIALIQAINGCYRTSENFFAGVSPSIGLPSACVLPPEVQIGREYSDLSEFAEDVHFVKSGFLIKQGSLVKSWKRRLFTLQDGLLQYADSASVVKGERRVDNESRVVLMPSEYDGRSFCFALLTTDASGTINSLRLSAEDERTMLSWINAIETAIRCYKDDYQAFHMDDSDHGSSWLSPSSSGQNTPRSENRSMPADCGGGFLSNADFENAQEGLISLEACEEVTASTPTGQLVPPPAAATLSWYLNDDTLWGRMRRRLSWREHHVANADLQAHYMTHFCTRLEDSANFPISDAASAPHFILVEVFEHQRFVPLSGWSPLNLFPTDCAKLANRYGVKFPDRYLRRADAPADYCWTDESDAVALSSALTGTTSPWKWTCCKLHTNVGEKGWSYGRSFGDIRNREARNRSHPQPCAMDLTRRRRWLRVAVLANSRHNDMQLPFQNLFLRAKYSSQSSGKTLDRDSAGEVSDQMQT